MASNLDVLPDSPFTIVLPCPVTPEWEGPPSPLRLMHESSPGHFSYISSYLIFTLWRHDPECIAAKKAPGDDLDILPKGTTRGDKFRCFHSLPAGSMTFSEFDESEKRVEQLYRRAHTEYPRPSNLRGPNPKTRLLGSRSPVQQEQLTRDALHQIPREPWLLPLLSIPKRHSSKVSLTHAQPVQQYKEEIKTRAVFARLDFMEPGANRLNSMYSSPRHHGTPELSRARERSASITDNSEHEIRAPSRCQSRADGRAHGKQPSIGGSSSRGYSHSRDNSVTFPSYTPQKVTLIKPSPSDLQKITVKPSFERERGRTLHRKYEFVDDSDALSPVEELASGRDTHMTTMTEMIQKSKEPSTPTHGHEQSVPSLPARGPVPAPTIGHQSPSQGALTIPEPTPKNGKRCPPPLDLTAAKAYGKIPGGQITVVDPYLKKKEKRRPLPLDLTAAIEYGKAQSRKRGYQVIHNKIPDTDHKPLMFKNSTNSNGYDASSSTYSDRLSSPYGSYYEEDMNTISPIDVPKRLEMKKVNFLQHYDEWKNTKEDHAPLIMAKSPTGGNVIRSKGMMGSRRNSMGEYEPKFIDAVLPESLPSREHASSTKIGAGANLPKSLTTNDQHAAADTEGYTGAFTPLTPYFMGGKDNRKATKTLFGKGGWLEDTARQNDIDKPKEEPLKATGFIEKFTKKFGEITSRTRSRPYSKPPTIYISLDAREQSLLYCELEYNLSNALEAYIQAQLAGARLDPDKLKRIADHWRSKGRPRVIGFRYDVETQIDLVSMHVHEFRFYGTLPVSAGGDPSAAILGLLHACKSDARALRIRTFCQPDPVVAKHIIDAQSLMVLLNSPEALQRTLAEIAQFFKIIVEREKNVREDADRIQRGLPPKHQPTPPEDTSLGAREGEEQDLEDVNGHEDNNVAPYGSVDDTISNVNELQQLKFPAHNVDRAHQGDSDDDHDRHDQTSLSLPPYDQAPCPRGSSLGGRERIRNDKVGPHGNPGITHVTAAQLAQQTREDRKKNGEVRPQGWLPPDAQAGIRYDFTTDVFGSSKNNAMTYPGNVDDTYTYTNTNVAVQRPAYDPAPDANQFRGNQAQRIFAVLDAMDSPFDEEEVQDHYHDTRAYERR